MSRLWVHVAIGGILGALVVGALIFGNIWTFLGDNPSGRYADPTPGFWSGGPTPVPTPLPEQRASKALQMSSGGLKVGGTLGLMLGAIGTLVATGFANRKRGEKRELRLSLGITVLGAFLALAISAGCLYILAVALSMFGVF